MARIASRWGVILGLSVAVHTPSHGQRSKLLDAIHLLNFTVALLASDAAGNVPLVVKISEFRKVMHFDPLDGLTFVIFGREILNVWTVGFHKLVTVHANVHCWNGGVARALYGHMTVHTRDIVLAGVFFVTKWDGLNGCIPLVL
jgi:hypothetical protein